MSTSITLISIAQTALTITYYVLVGATSLFLSLALPYATFHLGRHIAGYHLNVGDPGAILPVWAGFAMYIWLGMLGLGDESEWYFLVNVPFGVGVGCVVGLGLWGVGVWVVRLVLGGKEKAKDS